MRILFASYTAETTGPTNSLLHLFADLGEHYHCAVLARGEGSFTREVDRRGIARHCAESFDKGAILELSRIIRRGSFDLVYLNNTCGAMRNTAIAASVAGVPYLCHVREMGWGKSWRRLGYLYFGAAVVAVSRACAASVRPFVRPERLHVVHNGVSIRPDDASALGRDAGIRAALGLAPDSLLILCAAHVCPRKGQEYAVAAMPEVLRAAPDAHLLLAGELGRDPAYVERLRSIVAELGVGQNVHFLGFRSDLASLYRQVDLALHTAVSDPHPRGVLEAMAARLPVVAFAVDGVAETVVDGDTGLTVPLGDTRWLARAIARLLVARDLRLRMGAAGQERAQRTFSTARASRQVREIIDSLGIASAPRAAAHNKSRAGRRARDAVPPSAEQPQSRI